MKYNKTRSLELLRAGSGVPSAEFREGQAEAISSILEGSGRLLVVQKTGWGKSFVYFIAAKLLRDSGSGPALLISPLISLMRNQLSAAHRMGVRAETINSDNVADWENVLEKVSCDQVDILLISPERLANQQFQTTILSDIAGRISLLVIDEAHCISDWGHDFRPDYRLIERIAKTLPGNTRLLATTATANDRVMADLHNILGSSLETMRGDLNRPSLLLQTLVLPTQAERMAWIADTLETIPGSGIIYTLTVRAADRVAQWLQSRGLDVQSYTARSENRTELEASLLEDRVKALVATVALGMGFDKPDLAFVIHYQVPGSVTHYYQQVGRAGRSIPSAYGMLLSGKEDIDIVDHFIEGAFPTKGDVNQVIEALRSEPDGLSIPQLCREVNVSKSRIEQTIKLLSLESPAPIAKQGSKWQLTPSVLSDAFWERAKRLTVLRHEEKKQMQRYVSLQSGHMKFLIEALDGVCEEIRPPSVPALDTTIKQETIEQAIVFLKRSSVPIVPRKKWPAGGLSIYSVRGMIPPGYRAEDGKCLSVWGDAGWGTLVRTGKYKQGYFADELVMASARLLTEWNPQPNPSWVTCVPSKRHPLLVPDFASRLAQELGLPFREVLVRTGDRPEQKSMANMTKQALNLDGALAVTGEVRTDPVLLVDDMVDSRWTFTVGAWLLRGDGCGQVWPFALAATGSNQD